MKLENTDDPKRTLLVEATGGEWIIIGAGLPADYRPIRVHRNDIEDLIKLITKVVVSPIDKAL